jgi:hypothetical protein
VVATVKGCVRSGALSLVCYPVPDGVHMRDRNGWILPLRSLVPVTGVLSASLLDKVWPCGIRSVRISKRRRFILTL